VGLEQRIEAGADRWLFGVQGQQAADFLEAPEGQGGAQFIEDHALLGVELGDQVGVHRIPSTGGCALNLRL
jgi:hypothetical protein